MRTERKFLRKMAVLLAVVAALAMGVVPGTVPASVLAQTASGTGWEIDASGKLTIHSDAGMSDWDRNGWSSYKDKVNSLEVGSGVTEIVNGTFQKCTFTEATIQSGVQVIGPSAFESCTKMKTIQIPDTVTTIESGAFYSCSSLESVALPQSLKELNGSVFGNCSSLTSVQLHEGLLTISEAFVGCTNLKEITIPSTVTKIKGVAFEGCTSLESIIFLSDTPPTLETGVFGSTGQSDTRCKFVKDGSKGIHVPVGKADAYKQKWTSWTNYITDAAKPVSGTDWEIDGSGKLTIRSNVGMNDWKSWKDQHSDSDWNRVNSVDIQNGVTSIVASAFSECGNLSSVTIGGGVTSIGASAFSECGSLSSVTIQGSVTSIGASAFYNCKSLSSITIPDSVTGIGASAFSGCASLSSITIPDKVTGIGVSAFSGCLSLGSITIPNSVTSIGDSTFSGCESLSSVTIGGSVTSIGASAFYNCKRLGSITIPDSVRSIGDSAFSGCMVLKSIAIPENVTNIGASAFYNCRGLERITIPDKVTSIRDNTFSGCSILSSVTIGGGVTSIGASAFSGCGYLTGITIPGSVTSIGNSAFYGCERLNSITIPGNVTSIGTSAFCGCSALSKVVMLRETPPTIGTAVFQNCRFDLLGTEAIHVPAGKADAYKGAWTEWANCITDDAASGKTDAEKAAEAKTVAEGALKTITVTNATTAADIKNAVDTALSSAGISGVTVTVKNFTMTKATTAAAGSIGGTIQITCGSATATVTIAKTIEKLPETEDAKKVKAAKTAAEDALKTITVTNATTATDIQSAVNAKLSSAGISGVTVTIEGFTMTKATTAAAGSIRGTVRIRCGNETDTVTITKTIEKLVDMEKAKTAAEGALKNIMVANTTTKEDILNAVNAALSSAGISGVTVTVENFTKTEATTETAGSIGGTIRITCGNETKTVTIARTIEQLPETEDAKKVKAAKTAAEGVLSGITVTNATTRETIEGLVKAAVGSDVTVTVENFTKTEATTEAAGSIQGTIRITCGNETKTVTIAKTIEKLPETVNEDAKKVEAAKTEAEKVLNGINVNNATTRESIESLVNLALSSAGISGVTVTVENFNKTEATTETAGSIQGTIRIRSGNETDTVTIAKTIEKLPVTGNGDAEKVAAAKTAAEGVLNSIPVSNATTRETIESLVKAAVGSDVAVTVENFNKTEATTEAPGSIQGTIRITCGNETDTVTIAKTIEKLPEIVNEDAKKVEAAKTEAEKVLNGIKVTNATTREDIESLVNLAVGSAGISGVTVTVENFTKTEATTEESGSIQGTIRVTCGNETDTVTIEKTIEKLPEIVNEDAKKVKAAKAAAEGVLNGMVVTNATTKESIESLVNAVVGSGVTVTVENFTKTEATTEAPGSIQGTIRIRCGNEADTVTITKTIEKLPGSGNENADNEDARKVTAAKTAAEGAMKAIKVTNATTGSDIQSAVNAAFGSAGISGVTVKVEGFTKTEATTEAPGSIRGKITITCGNETETVMIVQTIAKLPKTEGTGSMTEEEKASVGKLVKGLDVSEETAVKILAVAKELKVPMETLLIGENTLANHKSEGDIKGSTFQKLQAAVSKTTTKSVKLTWKKVKGADGYQVYAAKCGKANKLKLVQDTKKGSTYTQKKLKKGTAYRYVVRAYKVIDGKKITIAASKGIHAFTDGGKYGNTKSVKVNKSKVSLKKGRTYKLKASEVKAKKAMKKHRKICYESSNEKVATVTSKGVIKAKAKGTCTVYVYAQDGKQKKIKVTVK